MLTLIFLWQDVNIPKDPLSKGQMNILRDGICEIIYSAGNFGRQ